MELILSVINVLATIILGAIATVPVNFVTVPLCYILIWKNGKERKGRLWIYNAWLFSNIILFFILTILFYNYFFYNL